MKEDQYYNIKNLHFPIHNKLYGKNGEYIACANCHQMWPCHIRILVDFIEEAFGDALKTYFQ